MSLALSSAERADILRRHDATIRGSLRTKLATIGTIAALAGFFTYQAAQPDPPGLPTLRSFQRAQGAVACEWLAVCLARR